MNNKRIQRNILLMIILLGSANTFATKRYWVGNGSNKNWNSITNWSAASGGATGASIPVSTDSVYYDENGLGQCSIDATVNIKRLNVSSAYTDTIKQNTFAITVGTSGMILSGGTFWGGSANINNSGVFTLSGCNFTSTSALLSITGIYNCTSGIFTHNNGKIKFAGTISITGSTTFYDLEIGGSSVIAVDASSTFDVNHTFTQSGGTIVQINTGTLNLKGDINQTNIYANGGGSGTLNICGTGNQTFSGLSSGSPGWLCNIEINKSSGTLYLKDVIALAGKWEYVNGTVDITTYTSTIAFPFGGGGSNIIKGKQSLNNLTVSGSGGYGNTVTVNSGDTLTVVGNITTSGAAATSFAGIINLKGGMTLNNTYSVINTGGSGTIIINGTGSQTITGASASLQGRLCNVIINKASGTLTLKNFVNVGGNWTYTQGTIDATTYSSTVVFSNSLNRTISGTHTLNNVCFSEQATNTIPATDVLTVLGELKIQGTAYVIINTGAIDLKGDLTITNTSTIFNAGGTATININGTTDQTITGANAIDQGKLCNVTINKSGGTLYLKNIVSVSGNWVYTQGTIDATTYNSTLVFPFSNSRIISGSQTLNNVSFYAPLGAQSINNINTSTILSVVGELRLEGGYGVTINGGTVNAKGNMTITNTSASGGGTGTINVIGTADQTITGSSIVNTGRLCNLTINKPSGILFLNGIITVAGNLTHQQGNINPGASTIVFAGNNTLTLSDVINPFNNCSFYSGTRTLNSKLDMTGTFKMYSGAAFNSQNNNVSIGGNWDRAASGSLTLGTSTITFNGVNAQSIVFTNGTETFYKLTVNKLSEKLQLNSPVTITNNLGLINGIITTTSTNILSLIDNATSDSGSDLSYVSGPMKKVGNDIFTFALGDASLTTGAYHPLSITAPSVTTDAYTAQYYAVNQTTGSSVVDSIEISNCEYWTIARNVGTSNVKTTLNWNTNNCLSANLYDMAVSSYDGSASKWKSLDNTTIGITGSKGFVSASLTPFWNGTSASAITLGRKKTPTFNEVIVEPYCISGIPTGNINVTITNGAPPFAYSWSNGAHTEDITGLTANNYNLIITDRFNRTFTKEYTLENCLSWATLPTTLSLDSAGTLHKTGNDTTWVTAQSSHIIDSLATTEWIKYTVSDTTSHFLLGFGSVEADSLSDEANIMTYIDGKNLTVIETDNDGFYSKIIIGTVAVGDVIKTEINETEGIMYYVNGNLQYTGKLLSNVRLQYTANLTGVNTIKNIRCSSNN